MCNYFGNVGHLMQHWTLCELLVAAGRHHTPGLNFIDAHAMAPLATNRLHQDARFDRARARLPNQSGSAYERAWHHLAPDRGYPNNAAFVNKIWEHDFSLLLCEIDVATIEKLEPWLQRIKKSQRCATAKLFKDDWRNRFAKGLPIPSEAGLADGALTLVSFDPYKYNSHKDDGNRNRGDIYPQDLEMAMCAMNRLEGRVLIHLPTYSTTRNNPQDAVIASVDSILVSNDFTRLAVVRVNERMMSLVYARNLPWGAELTNLPARFAEWLAAV